MSGSIRGSVDLLPGKVETWQVFVGWTGPLEDAQIDRFAELAPDKDFSWATVAEMRRARGHPGRERYFCELVEMAAAEADALRTQLQQAAAEWKAAQEQEL